MKVLMIGQHAGVFRDLDSVMRELCRRGHQVVFLHGYDQLDEHRCWTSRASRAESGPSRPRRGRGVCVSAGR